MATTIPPPYFITADDKRGLIVVTVALVLAFTATCSAIRVWLRYQAKDWRPDDWLLASATILLVVQSGTILHLVNLGLGTSQGSLPNTQRQRIGKEGIAAQVFYICTLLLSKCSVLFLYLRLSSGQSNKLASYIVAVASLLWAIASMVLIAAICNPAQEYTNPGVCSQKRWAKWQAIGALDLTTELLIFGIAVQMVWTLQMRLKAKLLVIFAFSARLPVIAISAVRLHYLHKHLLGTSTTFEYIVVTQWHMGYAIMSSTITSIGPFLRPFKKEWSPSYYNSKSGYGQASAQATGHSVIARSSIVSGKVQRNSWQSEGYLMQPLPSRRSSKHSKETEADTPGQNDPNATKEVQLHSASSSTSSDTLNLTTTTQAPNMLTADANFRPIDHVSRHETDIWVGDRSTTSGFEDRKRARSRDERGLVINKSTQVTIEVDRASCVI